jgi:short-subunit dehydrogenase
MNAQHVVVTGASSGIGEALVREYVAAGARVTLVARRRDRLERIATEVGGETLVIAADLSAPEGACAFLAEAEARFGPVDVLVNNAGVQNVVATELEDVESGEALLRLNVLTPMRLTRAVLPGMLARKRGTIVDVASMAGITPVPGMFYYNAAKGGLANASEGLRGELRNTGVHVLTVYPGPVDTPMAQRAYARYASTLATRLSPLGTTAELAVLVRRAVERKKPRIVYPRAYAVARWFPGFSRWFTARFSPPLLRGLPASSVARTPALQQAQLPRP